MQISKSKLIHKAGILVLALIIVAVGSSIIDKNFHFFSKLTSLPGQVAGVIIVNDPGKFLPTVNLAGATGTAPYQDVQGDVIISGNVGIGFTSPSAKLDIEGSTIWNGIKVGNSNGNAGHIFNDGNFHIESATGSTLWINGDNNAETSIGYGGGAVTFSRSGTDLATKGTFITAPGGDGSPGYIYSVKTYNGLRNVLLNYHSGTYVGGVNMDNTSTSFPTSSDRRLKENIAPTASGLETLLQISINDFNFISEPSHRLQGFIAQDLYKYYPEAVTVGGDDVATHPWSVDYGRITPLLAKSIQDLNAKVDIANKIEGKLVETQKLIVSGVDILERLNTLSEKVDTQQQEINSLKQEIEQLKTK